MKRVFSCCLILILLMTVGCSNAKIKTSASAQETSLPVDTKHSNVNYNYDNTVMYKESEACSTIILSRINKDEKLNDAENKRLDVYTVTGDKILDAGTNDYDWLIIVAVKAARTNLNLYFDVLANKEKYTAIAKADNQTYAEYVKFQKGLVTSWCEKCFATIKDNVK